MPPTREATLVKHIVTAVREHYPDSYVWKVHGGPMQNAGVPDLVMCVRGRYVAIEVKLQRPGESYEHTWSRTTELQRSHLRWVQRAGGISGVALSVDEALDIVEKGLSNGT